MNKTTYNLYCEILKSELKPAMGCTEPIAIALTAAKAKKYCHGLLPYLYGVLCTIFHYSHVHVSYALDGGETVERDILVLGAGNGRYIGGGIPIMPRARRGRA